MLQLLVVLAVMLTTSANGNGAFSCPRVAPAGLNTIPMTIIYFVPFLRKNCLLGFSGCLVFILGVAPTDAAYKSKPYVDGGRTFIGGKLVDWTGTNKNVTSPIVDTNTGERIVVGRMAQMKSSDSLQAVDAAKAAWKSGQGLWPQMRPQERIEAMEKFVEGMMLRRSEIVQALMWEICKNTADAESEFDRTITFIKSTIGAYRQVLAKDGWDLIAGVTAGVRRLAVGIMLCMSPFNYPLNEAYATLIPALLLGNVAIMKVPATGGLSHFLTADAFARALPPGAINFVSGSGRDTMPPIMRTGEVDMLAFIGGASTADTLIKEHPAPHRLKLFLQLEGKNLAIVMPDADLDVAAEQVMTGSTSFNGQRCTAIKLVMVHESIKTAFLDKLVKQIDGLKAGLPWEAGVSITPLPEENKTEDMNALISDAVSKGAKVVNEGGGGGEIAGALMRPAVVYPVTQEMRLFHEEQFGPGRWRWIAVG